MDRHHGPSVVGDDKTRERVCEIMVGVVLQNSDGSPTCFTSQSGQVDITTPVSVGYPIAVYLGLCDADADA